MTKFSGRRACYSLLYSMWLLVAFWPGWRVSWLIDPCFVTLLFPLISLYCFAFVRLPVQLLTCLAWGCRQGCQYSFCAEYPVRLDWLVLTLFQLTSNSLAISCAYNLFRSASWFVFSGVVFRASRVLSRLMALCQCRCIEVVMMYMFASGTWWAGSWPLLMT